MLEILEQRSAITESRRQLEAWRASVYPSISKRLWFRAKRKLGLSAVLAWPDWLKSWDVCRSVALIRERVAREERVVDLGCFKSEVLWSLARLGYTNLAGCDLDQRCVDGLFNNVVQYSVRDLTHTDYPSSSCKAVTCLSVIEHGVDTDAFLTEARRLLQPNGYLVLSTDYWPESIDTSGVTAFGLGWRIFSRVDLEEFLTSCKRHGLEPLGPLNWRQPEPVISWQGRHYSFAWMALRAR